MPCHGECEVPPVGGAIKEQSELSPAQKTKGKELGFNPVKLTDLPGAMRQMGWKIAPLLMEKWQNSEAYELSEDLLQQYADDPLSIPPEHCDEVTVKMEWVKSFSRGKEAYDALLKQWLTEGSRSVLRRRISIATVANMQGRLRGEAARPILGSTNYSARQLHTYCQVQYKEFGSVWSTIDDLYGSIGNAALFLAVVGKMCGPTKFVVTDLGIYLRDVYEFNGFQPLGIWTKKRTYGKAKIKSMFDQSLAETAIQYIQEPFCAVFNSDFRAYRKKYDKGGDFFIFSDVAWEKPKEGPIIIPLYK